MLCPSKRLENEPTVVVGLFMLQMVFPQIVAWALFISAAEYPAFRLKLSTGLYFQFLMLIDLYFSTDLFPFAMLNVCNWVMLLMQTQHFLPSR